MKILVVNDDGIYAEGLWALVEELRQVSKILVVAPDREQSGIGTAVSLHRPLRINKMRPLIAGIETYAVEGTPADGVILALKYIAKDKVDLVFSGINKGSNLGHDVLISGTVGAALQGYFYQLPSIAISAAHNGKAQFGVAAKLARLLAERLQNETVLDHFLWSINLPDLPLDQIKGIEVTKLGRRSYGEEVKGRRRPGGQRSHYWILRETPCEDGEQGTDIWAVRNGKISITPLQTDLTGSSPAYLDDFCRPLLQGLRQSLG